MSRRKAIDFDDDYYDDGYYDDDYEEEEEVEDVDTQYMYTPNEAGGNEPYATGVDPSQTELLDTLAEGLRDCLGDDRIPRDQIDAVLVAADYDIDSAMAILREQKIQQESEAAEALGRLQIAEPSAIARMLDSDQDGTDLPKLPEPVAGIQLQHEPSRSFAFDEPSPDDLVQQRQQAGKARAKEVAARDATSKVQPKKLRGGVVNAGVKAKPMTASGVKPGGNKVAAKPTGGTGAGSISGGSSSAGEKPGDVKRKGKKAEPNSAAASSLLSTKQRVKNVKLRPAEDLATRFPSVSVVVAGHVDAGKSTLLGHMLRLLGAVSGDPKRVSRSVAGKRRQGGGSSDAGTSELAWTTDEDPVEQERGVTIDIATRIFHGRKSATTFSIIDAPGHRDYVPAMILGACQAGAALLVVDASTGEFESGFSEQGQTREHAVLLRSLGVSRLIVVVNKMDMVDYSQPRFVEVRDQLSSFLKTLGWRAGKDVNFVPAAGLSGINLVDKPPGQGHPLSAWYTDGTVLDALEALPSASAQEISKSMKRSTRLVVSDAFRSSTLGGVIAITGRLVSGTVAIKDQLRLSPTTEVATIKSIEVGQTARRGVDGVAVASADILPVSLGLVDIADTLVVSPGDVLCDPAAPVPVSSRFRGLVTTIASPVPLVQGVQVELHLCGMCEAASISKLVELKSARAGDERKKRPRRLQKGDLAVIEVTVARPICIELASDVKFLGRFALRCHGRTVAAGLVTELLKARKPKSAMEMKANEGATSESVNTGT